MRRSRPTMNRCRRSGGNLVAIVEEQALAPVRKLLARKKKITWRSSGTIVWLLTSLMFMAHVNGNAQIFESDAIELDSHVKNRVQKFLGGRYGGTGIDIFGTLMSLCVMFIVGVTTGFWWKGFQKVQKVLRSEVLDAEPSSLLPPSPALHTRKSSRVTTTVASLKQYRLKEIEDMTDSFKLELGKGGQGVVYFATLPAELQTSSSPRNAAVKRLQRKEPSLMLNNPDNHTEELTEKDFWAELNTISRLHHRNLVALLGYCVEEDNLFLVYEFMSKGSLSQHLHHKSLEDAGTMVLDWKTRMRCAVEVAQGLEYLHSHANPSLVHRDIKSGNILFDDDMQAKIADFGLSKPLPLGHEVTVSTRVRGTHGYVDPNYLINGQACDKNDVYSYGVVLLELITGRRAIQKKVNLVNWCKGFLGADEPVMRHLLPRMVDSRLSPLDFSYDQLYEVVKVARACVQERQESRPGMQDVVAMLYNANCKDLSSEMSNEEPMETFGSMNCSTINLNPLDHPSMYSTPGFGSPSYEIKDNTVLVKCTVGTSKIALRCKIWPTRRNFGLNKVEASLNGAFLWKNGLWWFNAKSTREFTVGDDIKVIAEWHVSLRTSRQGLAANDPRRDQGPFCVEYLALKDEDGRPLIQYLGDRSPVPEPPRMRRESSGSGSGSGSGSAERRRSLNARRSVPPRRCPSPR